MKAHLINSTAALAAILLAAACSKPGSSQAIEPDARAGTAYPLSTCVVSGEELGSMGAPITAGHAGTTVKFCCESCIPKFEKDPERFLAKLNP